MKKYQLYLLSLLSGLLLGLAWFPHGLLPLIFIAFFPLLLVEDIVANSGRFHSRVVFFSAWLGFFTWNIITTWWLVNASWGGAAMAIILNSIIMAVFFYAAHTVKKRIGKFGDLILICSWLAFEFIHLRWSLSWTWLNFGNVFADSPSLIQWYEITGVLGGSLWVLAANMLLFDLYKKRKELRLHVKRIVLTASVIVIPVLVSLLIKIARTDDSCKPVPVHVVILQPNVDPYNEKFYFGFQQQIEKMLKLAGTKVDSTTDYLVFPETALTEDVWEDKFDQSQGIKMLRDFMKNYPRLNILIGANTLKAYQSWEEPSETARKFADVEGNQGDDFYDIYNTALLLDQKGGIQSYHKSKLVQGVETMPFHFILKHFESLAMDMGGTTGSLGVQSERTLLSAPGSDVKIAPVVCYESIFGEYVTDYVKKGANLITIITNDGWWGNTPGYMQHLRYGRLRAIENRKWVVRSANTGVSCFIAPSGEISQAANYWVPAAIKGNVFINDEMTIYSRWGDYIGRIALFIASVLLVYSWLIRFKLVKKS
ncbi:MAG: apolipoprotein N-acyltransferase [Bacteroidia bacterium]